MSIELLLAFLCAVTYYRAGRMESRDQAVDLSFPWALMSALLSALVLVGFDASWFMLLLSQIGLFFGIGFYRALRDPAT
ncbi:hypothetical protein [Lysobacter panacisoli]|uniref:Uncharacterized protein n=1 Tax=Lysobacter panacisoli TaxID=1255263 RepID=A0ABP9L9C4_9GAMM|nr:hypothetical protein [Lysobacter panacisoli]